MSESEESLPGADEYLLPVEIAAVLRVSKMTVYRLITTGELPGYRIGHSFRVRRTQFDTFLRDGLVRPEE